MAFQIADFIANAMLDAYETAIGASPILRLRTGAPPANLAAASTGVVVATMNLPADFMANAAARAKNFSGTWQDLAADNAGTVGHYEIVKADAVTRCEQGTVTVTGGGGDMTIDNTVVNAGQQINVTGFSKSIPNNA
jgi:hypothetical protein